MTETSKPHKTPVIFTDKAQCRDCYRCVRQCPVKAIRVQNGQASIVEELCIACGSCFRQCPQNAKMYRDEIAAARDLIAARPRVIATIAPSFAALFAAWQGNRIASALRKLGFSLIGETAVGAWQVSRMIGELFRRNPGRPYITSACPTVNDYIEKYRPEAARYLTPFASPMVVHGRMLKEQFPDAGVVFIGPCIAKKREAMEPRNAGAIDAVLTFQELLDWLNQEGIDMKACEESDFDFAAPSQSAIYPLTGGSLPAADIKAGLLDLDVISIGGIEEIDQVLDDVIQHPRPLLIEALFCQNGCINGPVADWDVKNVFQRRRQILQYAQEKLPAQPEAVFDQNQTYSDYQGRSENRKTYCDDEINQALAAAGKTALEDQLNCGACGYPTCRDKAAAVLSGMAELEMCMPYMRRLAEQRTDRIIDSSPNGIVILDIHLNIISMNPAFRKMFVGTDALLGKPISRLMDPAMFETVLNHSEMPVESIVRHNSYHLLTHQIIYKLPDADQIVGIFVNITNLKDNQQKLENLRYQTVQKARELLDHQVGMAQKIAEFLGASTAQSEELLENLQHMAGEDNQPGPDDNNTMSKRGNKWNPNIYMPK